MAKYYFGYYKFLGITSSYKRSGDQPKPPDSMEERELKKSEYNLLLEDLEHVYPLPPVKT